MYICPTCQGAFPTEEHIRRHMLRCWYLHNPNYKSKPAPRSEDIITREVDNNITDFFNNIAKRKENG